MRDIALVTYSELPALSTDDQLLIPALNQLDITLHVVVWDDPAAEWGRFAVAVLRSTWDYHLRRDEFVAWVERASHLTNVWNPPSVVRWNSHKFYLRDLAQQGIPIVPTVWIEAGSQMKIHRLLEAYGWHTAVIKPAVSASAYSTLLVTPDTLAGGQAHLDKLSATHDCLVQPYMSSVDSYGERSLIFIDDELTHAVRRPAVLSQEPSSHAYERVPYTADEAALARRVLQTVAHPTLYARVDLVRNEAAKPCLLELELIEPSLFLNLAPKAVARMAKAIAALCP